MKHELAWVQRTDAGYEGECTCGLRWSHGNSDAIRKKWEFHAAGMEGVEGLRVKLAEIEGKSEGE